MTKTRLEAFSDGVLAIVITIMVLELKVPHGTPTDATFAGLKKLIPVALAYLLSFAFVGIYWNNHHHMLHTVTRVTGRILWANLHLLFWLSLIPFATAWAGENHAAPHPVALYGVVLLCCGIAYFILQRTIIASQGTGGTLARAIGADAKGKLSILLYVAAVALALWKPAVSIGIYVLVACLWFIPDRRIARSLASENHAGS
jgi:uncharacterized membrane protein